MIDSRIDTRANNRANNRANSRANNRVENNTLGSEAGIRTEQIILRSRDVNMYRRLRTSRLFEILQETSIRHTEELGAGRKVTLDRGLLWVVTLQCARIERMPEFDEEITVQTWPGDTMHVLFPRYYKVMDQEGNVLVHASAVWMLVDSHTRKCVSPDEYGIQIHGISTGDEIGLPTPPRGVEIEQSFDFEVPFRYVDLNGHMNNTSYFDLVEDRILIPTKEQKVTSICTEYSAELCYKDQARIGWSKQDHRLYVCGTGEKNYFKMSMEYE